MGSTTAIEWAHSTVNVWLGCTKVSPACKHCYAETNSPVRAMQVRVGEALGAEPAEDGKRRLKMWGPSGFRYETTSWEQELRALNRKAKEAHGVALESGSHYERPRVFINSLSDTFEDWQGPLYRLDGGVVVQIADSLNGLRQRFFDVVEACSELDILLLTMRPQNVQKMAPLLWLGKARSSLRLIECALRGDPYGTTFNEAKWPAHIWIGTTVENQEYTEKRIPELLKIPARVRFLSVEPLLEDLGTIDLTGIHWVIVGGESGADARPMHPDWVRSIRDQCQAAGVPFFFKQWGQWGSVDAHPKAQFVAIDGRHAPVGAGLGFGPERATMAPLGKKASGRILDGRTWDEVPR